MYVCMKCIAIKINPRPDRAGPRTMAGDAPIYTTKGYNVIQNDSDTAPAPQAAVQRSGVGEASAKRARLV